MMSWPRWPATSIRMPRAMNAGTFSMPSLRVPKRADHVLVTDVVVEIVVAIRLPLADMIEVIDVGARLIRHTDAQVLRRVAVRHDTEIFMVPFLAVLQRELGVGEKLPVKPRHRHFRLQHVGKIVGLRLLDHGERRQRALRRDQIQGTQFRRPGPQRDGNGPVVASVMALPPLQSPARLRHPAVDVSRCRQIETVQD